MSTEPFSSWAIVELMGHRRRAGRVTEAELFGTKLLRVDIPTESEDVTEFYGGAAIYGVHPCTEEVARKTAAYIGDPRPIAPSTFQLTGPSSGSFLDDDDADPEDGDADGRDLP